MASCSSSSDDEGPSARHRKSLSPAHSPVSSSSNNGSPTASEGHKIRPKPTRTLKKTTDPTTRRELKRSIEKKFRLRYSSLQQAYEQRLEVLAARVQDAVNQVHEDATIHCLQENALTNEYASARLGEIVHECFYGERERYIKAMSDQIAWQASDLREAQQKLKVVQRREADAKQQWRLAQRDVQALHHQLDVRVKEIQEQKKKEAEFKTRLRAVLEDRDAVRKEVDVLKPNVQALEKLQQEHEALKQQMQEENDHARASRDTLSQNIKELQDTRSRLELEKQASQQEATHLKHLLSLSENKSREVAQALQQLRDEDYPSKLARIEAELAHQQQISALAEKDHEDLKRRYEEFGVQVEQYMNEQAQEKAALIAKGEEQAKQLQSQLETVGRQAQDALKAKQAEATRAIDQLKFRQEALTKAERKITGLEERAATLEAQQVDSKLRYEKQIGVLEKEIVQWRHALEKEQEKATSLQNAIAETKERYERKIASLQEAMNRQSRQGAQEKELEARTRWQNDFVAKQDARIEELKEKYDAALENQQAELLRARQMALETANAAAAKWEKAKVAQKEEDELDRRRRAEDAAREKERKEEQRALQAQQRRMQQEFDEREKRLLEREKAFAEKEKREERQRSEEARKAAVAAATPAPAQTPSVVVLNMGSSDESEEADQRVKGNAVVRVNAASRRQSSDKFRQEQGTSDDRIPLAQHEAEVQAKEAQAALRAEERVQKLMQEFQERKETEFRAAMVNVRKGIQKLELSLEESKAEKKRVEEQLLSERQAFVALKNEFEEARDAKRTVVQRLEEANENLGRMRTVVRELQAKCQALEEQSRVAIAEKAQSDKQTASAEKENEELHKQLAQLTEATARLESSLDTSVESSEQSKNELLNRVVELEHQLRAREESFAAELSDMEEQNERQLRGVTEQYDMHLTQLQQAVEEAQDAHADKEAKTTELAATVQELTAANNQLQSVVEQMKTESSRHKKEFADLSRMHKNLTETMNGRVNAASEDVKYEQAQRVAAEERSLKAARLAEKAREDRDRCLRIYRQKLQELARDLKDTRKDIVSEMSVGWVHLHKEVSLAGVEWKKRSDSHVEQADALWRRKAKEDKQEWKKLLAQKDKEMNGLLSSQRVNDQSKYDQVMGRLETKSRELEEVERRLSGELDLNASLQQSIQKLEEEQRLRLLDLSKLQEQLAASQSATREERQEKDRVRALLKTHKAMCQVYREFAGSIARSAGTEVSNSIVAAKSETGELGCDPRQLSEELRRLTSCVREAQVNAVNEAVAEATATTKEGVSAPLVSELESAKQALAFIWDMAEPSANADEYDKHLPWYLRTVRVVKQERDAHQKTVASLEAELATKESEKQNVLDDKAKWQEANKLLRFEKDTVLREMELLQQTLQKRKDQELEELRAGYDVRMEQLKQRHDRAIMKADQDNETALNQLRDMLELERRATSHTKNEVIELRMTLERTEEELKEAQLKQDKETEELRETASKWKRKAKLAMKGATATSSKAALRMSSSSHGTEEDSDASYRMMYPYSRRASNAMADLSNLMEQSLVSIRKEALIPQLSPRSNR